MQKGAPKYASKVAVVGATSEDDSEATAVAGPAPPDTAPPVLKQNFLSENDEVEIRAVDLDRGDQYDTKESVWDTLLFVGLPCIGPEPSAVVLVTAVLTAGMQLLFCSIVIRSMVDDSMDNDQLDSLLRFRASVAHDVMFADRASQVSMLHQICSNDYSLALAGSHRDLYDGLQRFAQDGQALCIVSIALWLGVILCEVDCIWRYTRALQCVPRGPTRIVARDISSDTETAAGDGLAKIEITASITHLHPGRFMFVLGINLIRLTIAVFLGYAGVRYLAKTNSLEDLVLNAVALGFVLEVDELFFPTLIPRRVQCLMKNMEPLPLTAPGSKAARGCPSAAAMLYVAFGLATIIIVNFLLLTPFFGRLQLAMDILCSGNVDFVKSVNPVTEELVAGVSQSNSDWAAPLLNVLKLARPTISASYGWIPDPIALAATQSASPEVVVVPETAPSLSAADPVTHMQFSSISKLATASAAEVASMTAWSPCTDSTESSTFNTTLQVIARRAGLPYAASCKDLFFACSWLNMSALRIMCSNTCKCGATPTPAGIFGTVAYGCASSCYTVGPAVDIVNLKQGRTCTDYIDPLADPLALTYVKGVFEIAATKPQFFRDGVLTMLADYGRSDFNLTEDRWDELAQAMTSGSAMDELRAGRWNLAPGIVHPTNLTGCSFLASYQISLLWQNNVCAEDDTRSFRHFCPVACGCKHSFASGCPLACGAP